MKENHLLEETDNYRRDCCGPSGTVPVTNSRGPGCASTSIFIWRQSARMFYSATECLMCNYSLSKHISTLDHSSAFLSGLLLCFLSILPVWSVSFSVSGLISVVSTLYCGVFSCWSQIFCQGFGRARASGGVFSNGCFVFHLIDQHVVKILSWEEKNSLSSTISSMKDSIVGIWLSVFEATAECLFGSLFSGLKF